jgi:RNA polymerase sigma-70 factor (ECF subfamily)
MTEQNGGVLEALVENHRRFLAFVERRTNDRVIAEDILQQAFVKGLRHAGEIRDEERVVAWFYRVLRNALADHWRGQAAELRALQGYSAEVEEPVEPPPEVAAELCRCFEPLLRTLKPEYAEILRRVDLGEVRPVDFAVDAGITANNAMVRLHRARQALRKQLEQSCRTCATHGCLDCSCGTQQPEEVPASS